MDENLPVIRISVRNLVEFILREGDIDNRTGGGQDPENMQMGSRIHRKIQRQMGSDYQAEVPLKTEIVCDGFILKIEGRADGLIHTKEQVMVDEIKGVLRELDRVQEPSGIHLAQAKCYASMVAEQEGVDEIGVQMTYCQMETEEVKRFQYSYQSNELKVWFDEVIRQYEKWAKFQIEWRKARNASIKGIEFPFPYRKGQRELAVSVYRTILRKKKLFIQAPTGVGKTISTVFPAVKAVGEELGEKIFYLTAKTITRTVAEQAFETLREQNLKFKAITLTAKEKICFCEETICNPDVCPYAKGHFDRVNDADIKVTATAQIASMYIRKQNIYTEKKIYPYATINDLRTDLLPRIRQMAVNHAGGSHPWENMSDEKLLQSAGLYGTDVATGESGYNLAAILLLGKDEVIQNVCPAYETDALVRKVNVDRYDDREIVRTNLIESFDLLMDFIKKHLPDKFFLEDENRVSLRNIIGREIISNTLMHREYTSSYAAKLIIKRDQMYTENANRATSNGFITPDNLEPNPKNPVIASFFRNIGRADRLGSGVHKLFKYTKLYSAKDPIFQEGDVFRIVVPLDDSYSFDMEIGSETRIATDATDRATNATNLSASLSDNEQSVLNAIRSNPKITQKQLQEATGITLGTIKRLLPKLQEKEKLERVGNRRSGQWKVND